MSTAVGKALIELCGARVGGTSELVLPYYDSTGKFIDAKLRISMYVNDKRRRDGSPGTKTLYQVTAWGPLAWTMALTCGPGKELHIWGIPRIFDGRAFDKQGNLIMWGKQPLMIKKFGITIDDIRFGADGRDQVQKEIRIYAKNPQDLGGRPHGWDVPGSQEEQIWKNRIKQRLSLQFADGATHFGFAKIRVPDNPGCRVLTAQEIQMLRSQGRRAITGGTAAPAQNTAPAPASGFGGPAPVQPAPANQASPQTVAAAFGAPAQQPAPANPPTNQPAFSAPNAAGGQGLGF